MVEAINNALKKYFGYSSFREGQDDIINSILQGKDTFCIMPTGGGKSICYQLPALLLSGVTIVISPLISLMKDQVDALDALGIPSTYINSSLYPPDIEKRIDDASKGIYKLIYIAPERLESDLFRAMLKRITISMVAIDEAHCVSQWGHDFRPSYLSITTFISEQSKRPIVAAFTATATEAVKNDILKQLALHSPSIYVLGFDRENLYYSIERGVNKNTFIEAYLNSHKNQMGIIYAATRKEVNKLHEHLLSKGFSVSKYHAGMNDYERKQAQESFIYDNTQIIIATNAFGMGIDKSNVRFVIHYNLTKNMESYYQEAGRAGRDGLPSECILLFSAGDIHLQKFLIENSPLSEERKSSEYKKLQDMVDYCHTNQCLRQYILNYFGDKTIFENSTYRISDSAQLEETLTNDSASNNINSHGTTSDINAVNNKNSVFNCNNCSVCNDDSELVDISIEAQKIFSCIKRMDERFGVSLISQVLKGSTTKKVIQLKFNKLSTYGIMSDLTLKDIQDIINMLIAEDYLAITEGQYPIVKLTAKAIPVLKGHESIMHKAARKVKPINSADSNLFEMLRSLRKSLADKENVPPYIIFSDKTLKEMSICYPVDSVSMLNISGVGEVKLNKYGTEFIEIIKKYVEEHKITLPQSSSPNLANSTTSQSSSTNQQRKQTITSNPTNKIPTHILTYQLYKEGKSIANISVERDITDRTVEDHLIKCAQENFEIEWGRFITQEQENVILKAIKEVGAAKLKPIKEILPDEISYFMIRAILCKNY